jgi:hypothetical protein
MKTEDAADVLTQVVATLAAGRAGAACQGAIHDDRLAWLEACHARADARDFSCGFSADDQRQLAPGERHAAIAPDVEMIERNCAHADLDLAGLWRGRIGDVQHFELAFLDKAECAHGFAGRALI